MARVKRGDLYYVNPPGFHAGEFSILREFNRAAYDAAGLSYDTKFDLGQQSRPNETFHFNVGWFLSNQPSASANILSASTAALSASSGVPNMAPS